MRRPTFDGTILIDQREADRFLESQLKPEWFDQAGAEAAQPLLLPHTGCDCIYWCITSFIDDRVRHHAEPFGLAWVFRLPETNVAAIRPPHLLSQS